MWLDILGVDERKWTRCAHVFHEETTSDWNHQKREITLQVPESGEKIDKSQLRSVGWTVNTEAWGMTLDSVSLEELVVMLFYFMQRAHSHRTTSIQRAEGGLRWSGCGHALGAVAWVTHCTWWDINGHVSRRWLLVPCKFKFRGGAHMAFGLCSLSESKIEVSWLHGELTIHRCSESILPKWKYLTVK